MLKGIAGRIRAYSTAGSRAGDPVLHDAHAMPRQRVDRARAEAARDENAARRRRRRDDRDRRPDRGAEQQPARPRQQRPGEHRDRQQRRRRRTRAAPPAGAVDRVAHLFGRQPRSARRPRTARRGAPPAREAQRGAAPGRSADGRGLTRTSVELLLQAASSVTGGLAVHPLARDPVPVAPLAAVPSTASVSISIRRPKRCSGGCPGGASRGSGSSAGRRLDRDVRRELRRQPSSSSVVYQPACPMKAISRPASTRPARGRKPARQQRVDALRVALGDRALRGQLVLDVLARPSA